MSFWFDDSKTRGAADRCHRQTVKENLRPHFGVFGIFEGTLSRHPSPPGLSSMGGGSNCPSAPVDPRRGQCIALDPTAEVASSRRNSPS